MDQFAFTGEIRAYANSFAPAYWAQCNGQLMSIQQNVALFSLIGTYFGGDGTRTFGLPNIQGRVLTGAGQLVGGSLYTLGEIGGAPNIGLNTDEIASHTHIFNGGAATTAADALTVPSNTTNIANPVNKSHGGIGRAFVTAAGIQPDSQLNIASVGVTGNNLPHNNMMPYLSLTYCICLSGIFPSRA